jgi:tetratricopeptide (TPR) repeat protein
VPIVASPVLADLAYTRALAYQAGRDRAGEVIWLRRAAAAAPDRAIYSVALGLALADDASMERAPRRRAGLLAEAEAVLRDAVAREPLEPYNYFHLGQVLMIRAEAERLPGARLAAARAYDRAAELSPSRALFLDAAGLAFQQAERPEEALARYYAAVELQEPGAERAARIGDCLLMLGRYDRARSSYQLALKLAPRLALAHAGLSELLHREGDLPGALNEARLAVRFQFRVWRYREALAHLEAEMGSPARAVAEARAAARFAPPWEQDRLRALIGELKAAGER